MKKLNIVVTAGGVTERIDSVRKITNSSSGALGIKIANELYHKYTDANIIVIGSKQAFRDNKLESNSIEQITIESTADLEREVTLLLNKKHIDIFVHSMAVADYTVEQVIDFDKFVAAIETGMDIEKALGRAEVDNSSKLSSSMNMMIKMKQTTKIISLIKKMSPRTFLVGFKLLNNVEESELFDVAFDLLRKNRCNLVVANDIANIRRGNHRALIVYPEKSKDIVCGKDNIARELVTLIDKRAFVKHPQSCKIDNSNFVGSHNDNINDTFNQIMLTGMRLYKEGYLPEVVNYGRNDMPGTYGNISVKLEYNQFMITGRNVHKGFLSNNDVCLIDDVDTNCSEESVYAKVHFRGVVKPSIDTAIHSAIYDVTRGNAIIHIHTNKKFLGYPYIDEQFPCGSMEERDAIINALKRGHSAVAEADYTHVVQMKKHGLIVVGKDLKTCEEKIKELFEETPYINTNSICTDYEVVSHIKEVGANFTNSEGSRLYNLELNSNTIGCVWERLEDTCVDFGIFTKNNCPKGLHIVENYLKLYNKKYILFTTYGCNIADFYENKYNFTKFYENNGLILMSRN